MAARHRLYLQGEKMKRVCRAILGVYIVVCLAAIALVPLNAMGAFGMSPDPLSGVYALLLSAPWIYLTGELESDTSVTWNLALAAICMAVNASILWLLCSRFAKIGRR